VSQEADMVRPETEGYAGWRGNLGRPIRAQTGRRLLTVQIKGMRDKVMGFKRGLAVVLFGVCLTLSIRFASSCHLKGAPVQGAPVSSLQWR
jgi:hypothetical protein